MKLLLLAALAISSTLTLALADESANDLAKQRGLDDQNTIVESAGDLADQIGDAIPTKDLEESASTLADQLGEAISPEDNEESAAELADQTGGTISTTDSEESARELAERQNLETTPTPDPAATPAATSEVAGVNGTISAVVATTDGKVYIGGRFNRIGNEPIGNLARLDADGTLDKTFVADAAAGVEGTVFALAIDAQGGLIVGGFFNQAHGTEVKNLARYLPSGELDSKFSTAGGPNGKVLALAILSDGTIVVAGQFSSFANEERGNIAYLSATGQLAATTPEVDGTILAITSLPDGGVFAGGKFETTDGPRNVLRLAK